MLPESTPLVCREPFCRELLAILRHGEVRIRPVFADRKLTGYHVDWIDVVSGHGRSYSGDGATLKDAIEAAVIERFGILGQQKGG